MCISTKSYTDRQGFIHSSVLWGKAQLRYSTVPHAPSDTSEVTPTARDNSFKQHVYLPPATSVSEV